MNLLLLFDDDFVDPQRVRLTGRRRDHVVNVHRAAVGDELTVGIIDGRIGTGTVLAAGSAIELHVELDRHPPAPLGVTLVLALPRPKVLNRVIASATSMGVKRIYLINAWRVEKSFWKSPRLSEDNLRQQAILGLEQARDTLLPRVELRRLFRPFVEEELSEVARGTQAIAAHPYAETPLPSRVAAPVTLAVGPEGGFVAQEIESLRRAGFVVMTLGPRVLRVETAIAAMLGRVQP